MVSSPLNGSRAVLPLFPCQFPAPVDGVTVNFRGSTSGKIECKYGTANAEVRRFERQNAQRV